MISPSLSPKELTWYERLRKYDVHPKTKEDYRIQTAWGGVVSVIAIVSITYLFFSELNYSMQKELVDRLFIHSSRNTRITFSFNITFPDVACSLLSADAMDPLNNQQEGVVAHVFKTRLDADGQPKARKTKHEVGGTFKSEDDLKDHVEGKGRKTAENGGSPEEPQKPNCGNCYGAGDDGECCNTCDEVKAAYKKKGWAFMGLNVEQCKNENSRSHPALEDGPEGCNVHGSMGLTQESGNVHLAPGEQLRHSGSLNVADLVMFTFMQFNISHEIHSLSFGADFPGFQSPLDNQIRFVEDGYGMYQYYIKLVPTVYRHLDGTMTEGHQYSVTEHLRHINPGGGRGLPGVWFFYDTSPVHVEFQERRRGYLPFLTSVCAIVGGIFSLMGVLDKIIHNVTTAGKKGKAPAN